MFNIVKRRDFMLGQDVATAQEAEQRLRDQYDCDYIVPVADAPALSRIGELSLARLRQARGLRRHSVA